MDDLAEGAHRLSAELPFPRSHDGRHGLRHRDASAIWAKTLNDEDFTNVSYMDGKIDGWTKAGIPVEPGAARQPARIVASEDLRHPGRPAPQIGYNCGR